MNRRLRNPAHKPSPSRIEERLHRFLRPGALARLRDSRIIARSPRSSPLPRLSPPSSPSPSPPAAAHADGFPCFASRTIGPRFLQRKKLAASKSVFFVPLSPVRLDLSDPFGDAFAPDLVAAH